MNISTPSLFRQISALFLPLGDKSGPVSHSVFAEELALVAGQIRVPAACLAVLLSATIPAFAGTSWDVAMQRAQAVCKQMTLDEKVDLLGDGFRRGISSKSIPTLLLADGPQGFNRPGGPAIAYPSALTLAATWNPELASRYGSALAEDWLARGTNLFLAPGVNLYRMPLSGRNYEYMGEDPLLTGKMVVPWIRALQDRGVMTVVKHLVGNDQEFDRYHMDSRIDPRTLRELYLKPFEAAVKEGGVRAIMTGHNKLNGAYAAENRGLLTDIVCGEWNFNGVFMTDWNGRHDGVAALKAGMDLDMPVGKNFELSKIKAAIQSGVLSQEILDRAVARVLATEISFDFWDRPQKDSNIPEISQERRDLAEEIAREGTILLKNEGGVLPLDKNTTPAAAVLGSLAGELAYSGGGSGRVKQLDHLVSLAEALKKKTSAGIDFRIDDTSPFSYFCNQSGYVDKAGAKNAGLAVSYSAAGKDSRQSTVKPLLTEETKLPFDTTKPFSAGYEGWICPVQSAPCTFAATLREGVRIKLDGKTILEDIRVDPYLRTSQVTADLTAGKIYHLEVEYVHKNKPVYFEFGWGNPDEVFASSPMVKSAGQCAAAVICAGLGHNYEGEDRDRPYYRLPGLQDDFIRSVTKVNPKTVVILFAGGSVETASWIGGVKGFLDAFYPGQQGGDALASILLGETNPSGKLPISFERRLEDSPAYPFYSTADPKQPVAEYKEGLFLGYRGFDFKKIDPLFPFGFGLGYTTFSMDRLSVERDGDTLHVSCSVKNTGKRQGAEVIQIYVAPPDAGKDRPLRELKAFQRVDLGPGEETTAKMSIPLEELKHFDPDGNRWILPKGEFTFLAGDSSRNLPLNTHLTLP